MTKSTLLALLAVPFLAACVNQTAQTSAMEEPMEPMAEEIAEPSDGFANDT